MPGQARTRRRRTRGPARVPRPAARRLRLTAYGLTDEQARRRRRPSALSVGGLVKHVTPIEQGWIDTGVAARPAGPTRRGRLRGRTSGSAPTRRSPTSLRATTRSPPRPRRVIARHRDLGQRCRCPGRAVVPGRPRRLVGALGAAAPRSRRSPATPATPTSSASRSTGRPCSRSSPRPRAGRRPWLQPWEPSGDQVAPR